MIGRIITLLACFPNTYRQEVRESAIPAGVAKDRRDCGLVISVELLPSCVTMVLMKDLIEDFLAKRAKWESDYASHDWSKPHFERVRISGVPQGLKLRQQYCKKCLASYDDNTSVTCTGKPAHLFVMQGA